MSTDNGFNPWRPPAEDPIPTVQPVEGPPLDVVPAEEPRPPHPGFLLSAAWCLAFLLITQIAVPLLVVFPMVLMEVASPQARQLGPAAAQKDLTEKTLVPSFVAAQLAGLVFTLVVVRLMVGRDWLRQFAVRRPSLAHTALVVLGFPTLIVLGNLAFLGAKEVLPSLKDILQWLFGVGIDMPTMEEMVEKFRALPTGFAVLLIGVGPGITEELWCRGFLGRGLVGRYGVLVGVLLTSFFFGAIHVDPQQGTYAMLMGIPLHLVYLATRSLWLPILIHILNNSAAVVHDKIPGLDQVLPTLDILTPQMVASASALFLAVGWALYESRARLVRPEEAGAYPWRPSFPGVEYPPDEADAVIHRPNPSLLSWALVFLALVGFGWAIRHTVQTAKPKQNLAAARGLVYPDSPCLNKA